MGKFETWATLNTNKWHPQHILSGPLRGYPPSKSTTNYKILSDFENHARSIWRTENTTISKNQRFGVQLEDRRPYENALTMPCMQWGLWGGACICMPCTAMRPMQNKFTTITRQYALRRNKVTNSKNIILGQDHQRLWGRVNIGFSRSSDFASVEFACVLGSPQVPKWELHRLLIASSPMIATSTPATLATRLRLCLPSQRQDLRATPQHWHQRHHLKMS